MAVGELRRYGQLLTERRQCASGRTLGLPSLRKLVATHSQGVELDHRGHFARRRCFLHGLLKLHGIDSARIVL